MKTKITLLLLACFLPLLASAQSTFRSSFAYVNTSKLNVRSMPNTDSQVICQLLKYQVINVGSPDAMNSEWANVKVEYYNDKTYEFESVYGYVNTKYLTLLADNPIKKSQLNGKYLSVFPSTGDLAGYLQFTFKGDKFNADYRLHSKEMMADGGSGTLDWGDFTGSFNDGYLTTDDKIDSPKDKQENQIIYDAKKGLLYCIDILWSVK